MKWRAGRATGRGKGGEQEGEKRMPRRATMDRCGGQTCKPKMQQGTEKLQPRSTGAAIPKYKATKDRRPKYQEIWDFLKGGIL